MPAPVMQSVIGNQQHNHQSSPATPASSLSSTPASSSVVTPATPAAKGKSKAKSRASASASKDKEKKTPAQSSSHLREDDDINDVAAMGGVNLAEENQRMAAAANEVGTQIRSCKDETFFLTNTLANKITRISE